MADRARLDRTDGRERPRVMILCAVDFTVRRFLTPLARHLADQGCEVTIGCTPGPYWQGLLGDGFKMVPIRVARRWNPLLHSATAIRLWGYLRRNRIDIVHAHTPVAGLIGRIAARLAGVPIVLYTAHGFTFHDRMGAGRRALHAMLERLGARFHDHLFVVSEEDAASARRLGIERPSRTTVAPCGVDPALFDPESAPGRRRSIRAMLGIPAEAAVVMFVGRLTREKGVGELLRAVPRVRALVPGTHFVLVGGSLASDRDSLEARARDAAADPALGGALHVTGFREDVPTLLAAADLFVLPSHREGLPVSAVEAMMSALPVVATNVRGCREVVADGKTGLLVEPGNARDLADAIAYLLKHRDLAREMGAAGRARALEHYAAESQLAAQWNVYRRLIAERLR